MQVKKKRTSTSAAATAIKFEPIAVPAVEAVLGDLNKALKVQARVYTFRRCNVCGGVDVPGGGWSSDCEHDRKWSLISIEVDDK